jgi:transcriptional regulator with XRE-family HTH domain
MGIRPSYISEIELGKRNIAVLMLLRLARGLDIPVAWLLAGLETPADFSPSATEDPLPSREVRETVVTHDAMPFLQPGDQAPLLLLLGATIRQYRQQRPLTQVALAAMAGVSPSHLCQIEQGHRSVSVLNLVSIARACGLSVSSLLVPLETSQARDVLPLKDTSQE